MIRCKDERCVVDTDRTPFDFFGTDMSYDGERPLPADNTEGGIEASIPARSKHCAGGTVSRARTDPSNSIAMIDSHH